MLFNDLQKEVMKATQDARDKGYTVTTPEVEEASVFGTKLAYYSHGRNKIVFHNDYVANGSAEDLEQTMLHELAHAIAEQNNTTKKGVWHGQAWKDVLTAIGGNPERYHTGTYKKPAFVKMDKRDMFAIQPKQPATAWERGTYNQWLLRGYHVIKGQKGQFTVWEFVGEEYETSTDGKTSNYGKAYANYFTADQVEPNQLKVVA